ncbi:hypothetical protein F511_30857 [Dorcoceras hygrometricum]|uniref:Uncharacterized protein n=1 Tax=Dorcoceras hygrometricum TaxID=472368 RepID=A0A2Z7AQV8_9LAMI|nr:hypothetical protein F511_30857 [Dorcoceras hygrometricum]
MPELDWSKISSWNSKGTPKLVRQFTSRSAENIKLVHQLDVGAARRSSTESKEQFKRRIKSKIEVQSPSAECSSAELVKRRSSAEDKSSWMRRNQLRNKFRNQLGNQFSNQLSGQTSSQQRRSQVG